MDCFPTQDGFLTTTQKALLHITTRFSSTPKNAKAFNQYNIAGWEFNSEFRIPFLKPFAGQAKTITLSTEKLPNRYLFDSFDTKQSSFGWLANQPLSIDVFFQGDICELHTETLGRYQIRKNEICCFDRKSVNADMLFGPCFASAAILSNQYHVHASAVARNNKATLFFGRSGAGKSTLAHYLQSRHSEQFTRLTDDISPVEYRSGKFIIRSHFPQLKLHETEQNNDPDLEKCEIERIFLLDNTADSQENIEVERIDQVQATMECIKHSVATTLFSPALLKQHLDFVTRLVKRTPVYRLHYPHNSKSLPQTAIHLLS